ncbi:DUF3344 domain-containing protein [Streptomyces sp. BI20]|uniref:DUF3344 domain-containing protein n=1 Tax=Streptomyces sp. BI20 TaxID=3403460 RepID=UPI003C789EE5
MGSCRRILGVLGLLSSLALSPSVPAAARAVSPVGEKADIPLTRRYQAVRHGGLVRASNSAISCRAGVAPVRPGAPSCAAARAGAQAANGSYEMFYSDLDDNPDTYNTTRAELRIPAGAKVEYARLYWGGNLRVGEQKPPADNGRVLIAEPGGAYREVLADTLIGHRTDSGRDAYQASADVTPLVRSAGSGLWTVSQLNVAMGNTPVGAWGGWTLVVAYDHPREPLRRVSLWDGFGPAGELGPLRLDGLGAPPGAAGRVGLVAYDGDPGVRGDSLTVTADRGASRRLGDAVNPPDDVLNSTISEFGRHSTGRQPEYQNTLGYDADLLDLGPALTRGADTLEFRLDGANASPLLGVLFTQTDVRP